MHRHRRRHCFSALCRVAFSLASAVCLGSACSNEERALLTTDAGSVSDTSHEETDAVTFADTSGTVDEESIVIRPDPVDFGRVVPGTTVSRELSITNDGAQPVTIHDLFPLDASGEFTVDSAFLALLPYSLETGGSWNIIVHYDPQNDTADDVPLEVAYRVNGIPGLRRAEVALLANAALPCLSFSRESGIVFGPSVPNQVRSEQVAIRNCSTGTGAVDLEVASVGFIDDAGRPSSTKFGLDALPELPLVVPPGGAATFEVWYAPTTLDVAEQGWLEIVSNDTTKSPMVVQVTGIGSTNACPVAVARCRVRGGSATESDLVSVDLLETIECTSEGTADTDGGAIVSYTWTLERPSSSATSLDSRDGPSTSFFVDAAGTYTLTLNVEDDGGATACQIPTVTVVAQPGEDIAVELTWDTPGDPDQEDEGVGRGSDADLHFRHLERGCWESIPWDCHWRNKQPEWGVPGNTTDNPGLDLDDTDGRGPENINLNNPETATYRVGAEYYNSHGYGPSDLTVRIYIDGLVAFESTRRLRLDQSFWEVADISWPGGEISRVDRTWATIGVAPCP